MIVLVVIIEAVVLPLPRARTHHGLSSLKTRLPRCSGRAAVWLATIFTRSELKPGRDARTAGYG